MTDDTVTVSKARLTALEHVAEVCLAWDHRPALVSWDEVLRAIKAIPPKPEELIQMEGWEARIVDCGGSFYARWSYPYSGSCVVIGPTSYTDKEAITVGNALLRDIARQVKP